MLMVVSIPDYCERRLLTPPHCRIEAAIVPAMVLIIVAGVYMVSQHGYHGSIPWAAGWVVTSFVVTVLLSVIGRTVEARDAKRLHAEIPSAQGTEPNADLRELQMASSPIYTVFFGTSQVLAVLFLMANRPTLIVSIAVCVAAAVVSVVAGTVRLRSVRGATRIAH